MSASFAPPNPLETPGLFPLEQLDGVIERVTYHNEENGYTVARLNVEGARDLVTIVGSMGNPVPGESVRLHGRWTSHREYGRQFQVERYDTTRPATAAAIEKYLGSGLIKGVGPVMAKRMVQRFGLETLDIIEQSPRKLMRVQGIGEKRIARIKSAWAEQKAIREVMLFLQGHGVSATYAVKIYKTYGDDSIRVVESDPYRLAKDIWGIGFKTADKIAQQLGFAPDSEPRLRAGLLYTLSEATDYGHLYLPEPLLLEKAAEILGVDESALPPILADMAEKEEVVVESRVESRELRVDAPPLDSRPSTLDSPPAVYHPALYHTEVGLANRLRRLAGTPLAQRAAEDKVASWLEYQAGALGIELSEEQRRAVYLALSSRFLVLTGGPGTGKTTVTNLICKAFEARHKRILLASPTGRAAKRLSEVTGQPAQTVHRLLKFEPGSHGFAYNEENPLECDVLIADEVSMLDAVLAHNLLKAVPETAQVVFVGDADQLPSVGAGNVLGDLIASGAVPVCRLTTVFRQAAQSLIVTNAHRVNRGEYPLLASPKERAGKDCLFVEVEDAAAASDMIVTLATRSLPRLGFAPGDIQVLSPMHRGETGVGHLNERLQDAWNPPREGKAELTRGSRRFRVGDRVIQLKNNYDKQIFNGDIGVITKIDHVEQALTVAFPEAEVEYDFADYDELQLAFAMSIHKCIRRGQRVVTRDRGCISIENLKAGEFIHTGTGAFRRVLNVVPAGRKRAMRLMTRAGYTLEASPEHPILVCRDSTPEFTRASDLRTGDFACIARQVADATIPVSLPTIHFPHTEQSTRWKDKEHSDIVVPRSFDEDLAWALGVIVGDGSYRDQRDGTVDVTNQDPEVLCRLRGILESYGLRVGSYKPPSRSATRLYVVSRPFREWLRQLGLDYSTACSKRIPPLLFAAPTCVRASFLRGLFDTDGSVGTGTCRQVRLSTCSPELARDTQQLLLTLGIISYITPYAKAYHVCVSGTALHLFDQSVGFSVAYKRARLGLISALSTARAKTNWDVIPYGATLAREIIHAFQEHTGPSRGRKGRGLFADRQHRIGGILLDVARGQRRLTYAHLGAVLADLERRCVPIPASAQRAFSTHFYYDPLVRVETVQDEDEMYDIEVEDVHSFVANGFVCHNSQGSEYPAVILVLNSSHYMMLQRNLLYTALTRARKMCVLVGEKRAIGRAVRNDKATKRFTRLAERLASAS